MPMTNPPWQAGAPGGNPWGTSFPPNFPMAPGASFNNPFGAQNPAPQPDMQAALSALFSQGAGAPTQGASSPMGGGDTALKPFPAGPHLLHSDPNINALNQQSYDVAAQYAQALMGGPRMGG